MVIIQRKNFHSLKLNFRISLTKLLTYLVVRMPLEENNLQKAQLFFANCRWEWQKKQRSYSDKINRERQKGKKTGRRFIVCFAGVQIMRNGKK